MFDVILQAGASVLLDPVTLGLMGIGTLAGLLAGAIPGFTIAMGVILTLPFTFGMSPIPRTCYYDGCVCWRILRWFDVLHVNRNSWNTFLCCDHV